jgi:hypothetical protein
LTAYVYPARAPYSTSLPSHFEECRREVRQLWGRTRSISKRSSTLVREGNVYRGLEEVFSAKAPRAGGDVVSLLAVYKAGDRYVKLRLTAPRAVSDKAAAQLTSFTAKFPWPRSGAGN